MDRPLLVRGHHLADFHVVALLGLDHPKIKDHIGAYTDDLLDYKLGVYEKLLLDPEYPIRITTGLDHLCNNDCPRVKASCSDERATLIDIFYAEFKHGFVMGEVYSSGEIFDRLSQTSFQSLTATISTTGEIKPTMGRMERLLFRLSRYFL
jgi:hypothetical protein